MLFRSALQGFGGVLAVVQRELVDKKKWLTPEEFVEDWAVAQILPGPNVVNLSLMLGDRYFGWRGSLVGVAGMLCFPLVIVLVMAAAFAGVADNPQAQGALRGMGAVSGATDHDTESGGRARVARCRSRPGAEIESPRACRYWTGFACPSAQCGHTCAQP